MEGRKEEKVKKIETKEIELTMQTKNENIELLENVQIDKRDINKNKEKVELMPAMEKVITYEIEKIEDENSEDTEVSENKFASAVVEEEKLENKPKMEKNEDKEKNEIKVEFMEIESELKGKADIELKSIRSDELIRHVKTDSKEEITKTILPSKDSERALAEKEEAKKTVKRLKLAEDKLSWCEDRLEELTKAGVLSEAEKEDIAGPIRLGRTYVRSKNASKAEKFARRAEEEAKHYLGRLKKSEARG
jgi:hypothetical protein